LTRCLTWDACFLFQIGSNTTTIVGGVIQTRIESSGSGIETAGEVEEAVKNPKMPTPMPNNPRIAIHRLMSATLHLTIGHPAQGQTNQYHQATTTTTPKPFLQVPVVILFLNLNSSSCATKRNCVVLIKILRSRVVISSQYVLSDCSQKCGECQASRCNFKEVLVLYKVFLTRLRVRVLVTNYRFRFMIHECLDCMESFVPFYKLMNVFLVL